MKSTSNIQPRAWPLVGFIFWTIFISMVVGLVVARTVCVRGDPYFRMNVSSLLYEIRTAIQRGDEEVVVSVIKERLSSSALAEPENVVDAIVDLQSRALQEGVKETTKE